MTELKFGWHMHSFPVDGSSGAASPYDNNPIIGTPVQVVAQL
jgi:hypothetical protein